MSISRHTVSPIVLSFVLSISILFLTTSCEVFRTDKPAVGQAYNSTEAKVTQLEHRIALLEKRAWTQPGASLPSTQTNPTLPAGPDLTGGTVQTNVPDLTTQTDLTDPLTQSAQSIQSAITGQLTPVTLYNQARAQLISQNIPKARALFSDFVQKFPGHDLANNAMYWLGECSYTTGDYATAASTFKKLVQTYPRGQKVPDALLKTGFSYISMNDPEKAGFYFNQVIANYPLSAAAEKARQKLSLTQ